jgi:hypothetical protein
MFFHHMMGIEFPVETFGILDGLRIRFKSVVPARKGYSLKGVERDKLSGIRPCRYSGSTVHCLV